MSVVVEEFFNRCHGPNGKFCGTGGHAKSMGKVSIANAPMRKGSIRSQHSNVPIKKGLLSRLLDKHEKNLEKHRDYIKKMNAYMGSGPLGGKFELGIDKD